MPETAINAAVKATCETRLSAAAGSGDFSHAAAPCCVLDAGIVGERGGRIGFAVNNQRKEHYGTDLYRNHSRLHLPEGS